MNLADFLDLVLIYQEDQHSHLTESNQICYTYFSLKCESIFSPSKSNFFGRSPAVNNVFLLKVLYKASAFTKTISRSDLRQSLEK